MDREVFPGRPLPSRSRDWAIASAIDHVSMVQNKLDEQACHAAVDHRHERSRSMEYSNVQLDKAQHRPDRTPYILHTYGVEGSEFYISGFSISTCYTLHEKLLFTRVAGCGYKTRAPEVQTRVGMVGAKVEFGNGLPGPSRQAHFLLLCNTSVL